MSRLCLALCLLLASLFATANDGLTRGEGLFTLPYLERELPNGLKVIIVPTDQPDVVSLQIPIQTGSRNEVEPGLSGFAHFFEHMMFRGTENMSADEYNAIIQRAGGDQNAYTTDDFTNYYINFTKADLEPILAAEADRFQNLLYSEEQFRTEALAVKGEYLKNFSNPVQKIFERMRELAFTEHTYGHTTMGYFRDIEDMPNQMEYSRVFFDRWYRPEYAAVILVGDLDPEATFALVERYFGDWQRGSWSVSIPVEPRQTEAHYDHIQWQGPTLPWLSMSYKAPPLDMEDTDLAALQLLSELYFGQTSELYQRLVVRERQVDALFGSVQPRKDPTLMTFGARLTDAAHGEAVIRALQDTLLAARSELVDASRLDDTRSRLKYGFAAGLDNAPSIAATLATFVQYERRADTLNRAYALIDRVTPEDIRAAANRWLVDHNRTTVTLSTDDQFAGAESLRDIDAEVATRLNEPLPELRTVDLPSDAPLINLSLIFDTGAAFDPPGQSGLAQLTASLMTQGGTQRRSYNQVRQMLFPLAAGFGAQVDKQRLRLSGSVHRDNLETWYGLVLEMLLEPGFDEEDFQRVKQQQINALRVNLKANNDEEFGKEALYARVFGDAHPYGRPNLGIASEIEAITLDQVRAFYREQLTQAHLTIGLSGGYPDGFRERLLRDLARLPEGAPRELQLPEPGLAPGRQALVIAKETPAVAVSFGFPISVARGHEDWVALWLVRSWLGEHRNTTAHLFQRIREERGMNYGNYAYTEYFPNGMYLTLPEPNYARQQQLFEVWIRPVRDNNDAHFATRVAMYELDRLIREGLSPAQFQASRDFLYKFAALMAGDQRRQLGYAMDSAWYGTEPFIDYVRAGLDALDADQVNAAIRRHLSLDRLQFVFITRDAEDLVSRLTEDRPSPISYNADKSAELLAEDAVIAELPLGLSADRIQVRTDQEIFE